MNAARILLVEDNPDDADLTVRAFRSHSPTVDIQIARDGNEALTVLIGSTDQPPAAALPSVVLLDLKLPGLDGFDVLRRIRASPRTRFVPVVILTSSNLPADLTTGYGLGANSYVRKPLSLQGLIAATQQLVSYWLQLNELPPSPA